ncbi:hypothetical protein OIV83_001063 [Microbotryomycetes sp. JL201]|nr:hypothetical protein OIV83_001063 [Microbotryomycetes sp. JL201]
MAPRSRSSSRRRGDAKPQDSRNLSVPGHYDRTQSALISRSLSQEDLSVAANENHSEIWLPLTKLKEQDERNRQASNHRAVLAYEAVLTAQFRARELNNQQRISKQEYKEALDLLVRLSHELADMIRLAVQRSFQEGSGQKLTKFWRDVARHDTSAVRLLHQDSNLALPAERVRDLQDIWLPLILHDEMPGIDRLAQNIQHCAEALHNDAFDFSTRNTLISKLQKERDLWANGIREFCPREESFWQRLSNDEPEAMLGAQNAHNNQRASRLFQAPPPLPKDDGYVPRARSPGMAINPGALLHQSQHPPRMSSFNTDVSLPLRGRLVHREIENAHKSRRNSSGISRLNQLRKDEQEVWRPLERWRMPMVEEYVTLCMVLSIAENELHAHILDDNKWRVLCRAALAYAIEYAQDIRDRVQLPEGIKWDAYWLLVQNGDEKTFGPHWTDDYETVWGPLASRNAVPSQLIDTLDQFALAETTTMDATVQRRRTFELQDALHDLAEKIISHVDMAFKTRPVFWKAVRGNKAQAVNEIVRASIKACGHPPQSPRFVKEDQAVDLSRVSPRSKPDKENRSSASLHQLHHDDGKFSGNYSDHEIAQARERQTSSAPTSPSVLDDDFGMHFTQPRGSVRLDPRQSIVDRLTPASLPHLTQNATARGFSTRLGDATRSHKPDRPTFTQINWSSSARRAHDMTANNGLTYFKTPSIITEDFRVLWQPLKLAMGHKPVHEWDMFVTLSARLDLGRQLGLWQGQELGWDRACDNLCDFLHDLANSIRLELDARLKAINRPVAAFMESINIAKSERRTILGAVVTRDLASLREAYVRVAGWWKMDFYQVIQHLEGKGVLPKAIVNQIKICRTADIMKSSDGPMPNDVNYDILNLQRSYSASYKIHMFAQEVVAALTRAKGFDDENFWSGLRARRSQAIEALVQAAKTVAASTEHDLVHRVRTRAAGARPPVVFAPSASNAAQAVAKSHLRNSEGPLSTVHSAPNLRISFSNGFVLPPLELPTSPTRSSTWPEQQSQTRNPRRHGMNVGQMLGCGP